jgi:hypothetical protein
MRGNKERLFHVYIYQVLLEAIMVAVSLRVCPLVAAVPLVPLAHGLELRIFPDPPRRQRRPSVFLSIAPRGNNLKNQNNLISRTDNAIAI